MGAGGNGTRRNRGIHGPRLLCFAFIGICRFSGLKIYPGRTTKYFRSDATCFIFLGGKNRSLYNQRKKPSKIAWTFAFRKAHRKDQESGAARRRRVKVKAAAGQRSIGGASMEVIQKKRAEKPELRQAARDVALREIKDRVKKAKDDKKAKARAVNAGKSGKMPAAKQGRGKR